MFDTLTITTKRPCCGRPSHFVAIASLPAECYTRRCRPCETMWEIQRRRILVRGGVRMDRLDWTDTQTGEFVEMYGQEV